jgi:hypothetical protein
VEKQVNKYTTEFFATCPNNGVRIKYTLRIETHEIILVERIITVVSSISDGFHEDIADVLLHRIGGVQTLTAEHHGVTIETVRSKSKPEHFLNQSLPGMAGTPGY